MLRLNVNEEKQLTFEVQIGGIQHDQLTSHFRIVIGEVEYGFPARVGSNAITVDLPPLNKVVGMKIREGDEAEVKLELVADGHYLTPWQDRAKLSNPLIVEATIKDDGFVPNPTLRTRLVVKDDGKTQQTIVEEKVEEAMSDEELTNSIVNKLSEKFSHILKEEKEEKVDDKKDDKKEEEPVEVKEEKEEKVDDEKEKDEEPIEESTTEKLEKLLTDTIKKLGINEGGHSKKSKKEVTLQEFKRNLDHDMIIKYIEKAGTKNKKIQDIVYEQAVAAAGSGKPVNVLKQVINIMKKK